MTGRLKALVVLGIVLSTVGCDRVTKRLAVTNLRGRPAHSYLADTVRLQYVENRGAFLSLGADLPARARTGIFVFGTGLLLAAIGLAIVFRRMSVSSLAGLSLIWAGGVSNLIDRVWRGGAVDFMNVGLGPLRTGIFNVADVAIMAGMAAVVLIQLGGRGRG